MNYNFADISVLCRKRNGLYINLTDYDFNLLNTEKKYTKLEGSKSRYALTLFGKFTSEITIEELERLAGLKSSRFISQIMYGIDGADGEMIVAMMCAKKILNYHWGKCVLNGKNGDTVIFEFTRHDGRGNYPVVLRKEFSVDIAEYPFLQKWIN